MVQIDEKGVSENKALGIDAQANVKVEPTDDQFVWSKNWYPVAGVVDLDPAIPNERWVLGRKIVLWKDESEAGKQIGGANGCWRATDDACPHRLASLSLGRVKSKEGCLMCRYHGWEFDGEGKSISTPGDEKASSVNHNAFSYPCQTAQGIVWVWPDTSPSRFVDAVMSELPPEAPECAKQDEDAYAVHQFDVPCDWEIFTENTFDPIHAMSTHEGTLPSYLPENMVGTFRVRTLDVSLDKAVTDQGLTALAALPPSPDQGSVGAGLGAKGFALAHTNYDAAASLNCTRVYIAPCTTVTRYSYPGGRGSVAVLHKAPTRPGYTSLFAAFGAVLPPQPEKTSADDASQPKPKKKKNAPTFFGPKPSLGMVLKMFVLGLLPAHVRTAILHAAQAQSKLFHQDNLVMDEIARRSAFARATGRSWAQAFALTSADGGSVLFRRWLDRHGGGGVPYYQEHALRRLKRSAADEGVVIQPPDLSDDVKNNHWLNHVRFCTKCRKGLATLSSLQRPLSLAPPVLLTFALIFAALRLPAPTAIASVLFVAATVIQRKVTELVETLSGKRAVTGPTVLNGRLPSEEYWPSRQ